MKIHRILNQAQSNKKLGLKTVKQSSHQVDIDSK